MKLTNYEREILAASLDKLEAVVAVAKAAFPENVDIKVEVVSSKSHCHVAVPHYMLSRLAQLGRETLAQQEGDST